VGRGSPQPFKASATGSEQFLMGEEHNSKIKWRWAHCQKREMGSLPTLDTS